MKRKLFFSVLLILISLTAFNQTTPASDSAKSNDEPDIIFTKVEVPPTFPGGASAWQIYITEQIKNNIDVIVQDGKSGTCHVKFVVDKDGTISNVEALTMRNSALAKMAVNAVANGPKWVSAKQNGYIVKAYADQPVTFTIKDK